MPAVREIQEQAEWDALLHQLPQSHLLQSWEWGAFKARNGWQAKRLAWMEGEAPRAAAQLLTRSMHLPALGVEACILYCPKGPSLDWSEVGVPTLVLDRLQAEASEAGSVFVKIDPDLPEGMSSPRSTSPGEDPPARELARELQARGWRPAREQVQFRNTIVLDLRPSEEDLLAGMKQKTRYNVRLAARRGVQVRRGSAEDLDLLYRMYAETSVRDGFPIRPASYYLDVWGSFLRAGLAQPFVASVEGEPVAGLVAFRFGETAWYLYGMSVDAHRERMPNYLLQWEAIRWAKSCGCTRYDLWGAPESFDESDPLWGVYRFKEGFGGQVLSTLGAWDFPPRAWLYWTYTKALPAALSLMRRRGMEEVRREVGMGG